MFGIEWIVNRDERRAAVNEEAQTVVDLREVRRSYATPSGPLHALAGVSCRVRAGELVGVAGRSGSGKSTLLNVMTGIDRPTSGEVWVAGTAVHALKEGRLAAWRGRNVGVVFQFFQLLPTLTVAENVALPMDFCDTVPARERRARSLTLLERVGIADQADKLPLSLSGGQQQRAAIARALANDPLLLVADEPTGNLDSRTGEAVWTLFGELAAEGKTVVVVTHDQQVSRWTQRVLHLADGAIVSTAPERELEAVRA
jgi:putative ABC transport system ATP-binding protein